MVAWKSVLGAFGLFMTRETDKAKIDDFPFQLQYRWTTALLFVFQTIISMAELVGKDSITCFTTKDRLPKKIKNFNKYANFLCWVKGTYLKKEDLGVEFEYLNDRDFMSFDDDNDNSLRFKDDDVIHLTYLQWIPFVLLIQGIMFYIPRLIWLNLEEGKLTIMLEGVRSGSSMSAIKKQEKEGDKIESKYMTAAKNVVRYIEMKEGGHHMYGMSFLFCQVLLVLNVIICIWFTNIVLDGRFVSLGFYWIISPKYDIPRSTVLSTVFPLSSHCGVQIMGTGGSLETYNFKCLLPPNVMLQYFILIMWFWYGMLLFVNSINLLLVICMVAQSAKIRGLYLIRAVGSKKLIKELRNENGNLSRKIKKMNFGQFLFLYFVARNTSYFVTENIMKALKHSGFNPGLKIKPETALLNAPNEYEDTTSELSAPPPYDNSPSRRKMYGNKNDEERIEMMDYDSDLKSRRIRSHSRSPPRSAEVPKKFNH